MYLVHQPSLCVCVFQYITSVYWVGPAEVVESVWATPSGVMMWSTVLTERMNLSAVRLLNQHIQALYFLLHYISGTILVTEHSFLSPIQSVSMGPTSFSWVTLLKSRHGCQCVLKTGTTIMGDLCVNTWDTRGCHHHCLLVSDDLTAWYLDT